MRGIASTSSRPVRRRALLLAVSALLLAAAVLSGASCRATIVAPTAPVDPVTVFLIDHGRHASLVLPREEGGVVRYSYGDWEYYALRRTGARESTGAVLWPTRAAFGRRELAVEPMASDLAGAVLVGFEELLELRVERAAVRELRAELDALFAANRADLVQNVEYDLELVPHPERYHLLRNSNHMVARWLRRLGCEVRGPTILSSWRLGERGS